MGRGHCWKPATAGWLCDRLHRELDNDVRDNAVMLAALSMHIRSQVRPAVRSASSALPALTRSASPQPTMQSPKATPSQSPEKSNGDRSTRIRSHVETRALACEKWLPLWKVIVNQDQVELRQRVALARFANIERMKLMYGPELSQLDETMRSDLLIALATLVSFESWDQLRNCYNLSADAAQALWRSVIDRMLPSRM